MSQRLTDLVNRRGFLRTAAGLAIAGPTLLSADRASAADGCCVDLSGRWTCGSWRSYCTGHHGNLRGVLHQTCDGNYRARFTGTFWKVFPFIYPATLCVVGCQDGVVYFRGSQRLPLLGEFCYHGHATCNCFHFYYSSRKDRGVFQMSR